MIGVDVKYKLGGVRVIATVMDKILVSSFAGSPAITKYVVRQQNNIADIIMPQDILEIIEPD